MEFKFSKMIAVAIAGLVLLTLLSPSAFAVAITRTISYDTSETSSSGFVWDATTFEGFYYSVNKNVNYLNDGWGERLYFQDEEGSDNGPLGNADDPDNNIIDDGELIYSITPYPSTYKLVSELGLDAEDVPADVGGTCYYETPWFGAAYVAVEGDATQLAKLVYKQGGSDKKNVKAGESWDLGCGYSLEVKQVDVEGNKVWFSLCKDGEELEDGIIDVDGTVESQTFAARADFGDDSDQLYFMTYVEQVFQGSVDSLAVFRYTWLIDTEDVLLISGDDVYQGFNVDVAAEDGLVLSNDDSITIDVEDDQKTYFTDSWYFQPSDENKGSSGNGYILYPAVDKSQPGTYTVRGIPADTALTSSLDWNPATFRGFYYSVNKNANYLNDGWGERLYFQDEEGSDNGPLGNADDPNNNIIDDGELIYEITPYTSTYKLVSELGLDAEDVPADVGGTCYYETPWFGVPYVAVEGDATQLAKLVYKQGGSDKKNVKAGENWDLGCGYSLEVKQVDVEGNKVWFSLCKDGEELEDGIIDVDGTVESQTFVALADFGDDSDQLYFMTYVEQVFQGSVDSLAVFRYTWLIDTEGVLLISSDDVYQGFNVDTAAEYGLVLSNDDSITIDVEDDQKTHFTDSWYFQPSDENKGSGGNGYILYPACDITVEDPAEEAESEEVAESTETEVIEPAEEESAEDEVGDEQAKTEVEDAEESESPEPASEEKSPGFGLLTAIFGISAVAFLVRRK